MGRRSMSGVETKSEIGHLCRKIIDNAAFITKSDMKVLEHLGKQGAYTKIKASLLTEKNINPKFT